MLWQTSLAAIELAFFVVDRFRQMVGLGMSDDSMGPEAPWMGLSQDGVSLSTPALFMVTRDVRSASPMALMMGYSAANPFVRMRVFARIRQWR